MPNDLLRAIAVFIPPPLSSPTICGGGDEFYISLTGRSLAFSEIEGASTRVNVSTNKFVPTLKIPSLNIKVIMSNV